MILLEAASGKHPFDGLSEQVINHHLATRPIEITGVADEGVAHLCRGLLLRDPARRYGAEEVARWLAGDLTLIAPRESNAAIVRPYQIGEHAATSGEELALALTANWPEGVRDLERGLIRDWLKKDLRDFELIRSLDDIMEARGEAVERRFLRFLRAAAPGLPPVWRGELADRDALLARARQAFADEATHADAPVWQEWLDSLFDSRALTLMGKTELTELDHRWRQSFVLVERVWKVAQGKIRHLRARMPAAGKAGWVVDFDSLVYGSDTSFRFPPHRQWHAPVLLALSAPDFLVLLRKKITQAVERFADASPWFSTLVQQEQAAQAGRTSEEQNACILVAWRLCDVARQEAKTERAKRQAVEDKRKNAIEAWRQTFLNLLMRYQETSAFDNQDTQTEWRGLLDELQALSRQLAEASYPDAEFERLLQWVSVLRRQSYNLATALDLAEARREQLAIFMQEQRLRFIGGGLLLIVLVVGMEWAAYLALGGIGFLGLLHWRRRQAGNELVVQMQRMQRQARALILQMKNKASGS
jgi:hypothetical protein